MPLLLMRTRGEIKGGGEMKELYIWSVVNAGGKEWMEWE